jgi:cyclophilin family peptidyl-prolyl cis-trans isomerase
MGMTRKYFFGGIVLAGAFFLAGCNLYSDKPPEQVLMNKTDPNVKSAEERTPREDVPIGKLTVETPGGGGQREQSAPQAKNETNPKQSSNMQIDATKSYSAILKTSVGDITIDLDTKNTPKTANNFVTLAKGNFYNSTIFHRVIKDFMIQGGDPKGDGSGGPGYKLEDEYLEGEYKRGTVAMANSGPNTNGSQFFIMHKDYDLPKNYVVFGQVSKGMEVVDKIAESEVVMSSSMEKSKPVSPVSIQSVEIVEK